MVKLRYPVKDFFVPQTQGAYYGFRVHPITGEYSFHNGVDISVPCNTPIHAQADGTISDIYYNDKGGLQLKITYKNGFTSGFAHLNSTNSGIGQKVYEGEIIAYSGGDPQNPNAGRSTGCHIHYTLRKNGSLIDPLSVDYKPFKGNTVLASFPFIPFKSPITSVIVIASGLLLAFLSRKK